MSKISVCQGRNGMTQKNWGGFEGSTIEGV